GSWLNRRALAPSAPRWRRRAAISRVIERAFAAPRARSQGENRRGVARSSRGDAFRAPGSAMSATVDLGARRETMDGFYRAVRALGRFWLWFFFKSVDVRHPERVPPRGAGPPARRLHYLAPAALFRNPLVGRFLRACGAIPVYRRQDDPDKMDRNLDAFEACFRAFRKGRLVAIYPEGTTHAEARVQRIKTGAARLALGYEAERPRELSVIPVGLNFDARQSCHGRVLVSFGAPVAVTPYLDAYRADPVKAVEALTDAIQWSMEAEVVHVARIDEGRLVRDVQELYRGELVRELQAERGLAERQIDLVRLSRAIVD